MAIFAVRASRCAAESARYPLSTSGVFQHPKTMRISLDKPEFAKYVSPPLRMLGSRIQQ